MPRLTNPILAMVQQGSDGDSWGEAMGTFFAVADVIWHRTAETIPSEWGYRHSPVCDEVDDESWPHSEIASMHADGDVSDEQLVSAGNVLSRYADLLEAAGQSY